MVGQTAISNALLMHPCFQACYNWREKEWKAVRPSRWASVQDAVGTAASQGLQLKILDGAGALPFFSLELSTNITQKPSELAKPELGRTTAQQTLLQTALRSIPDDQASELASTCQSLSATLRQQECPTVRAEAGVAEVGLIAVLVLVGWRDTRIAKCFVPGFRVVGVLETTDAFHPCIQRISKDTLMSAADEDLAKMLQSGACLVAESVM